MVDRSDSIFCDILIHFHSSLKEFLKFVCFVLVFGHVDFAFTSLSLPSGSTAYDGSEGCLSGQLELSYGHASFIRVNWAVIIVGSW